MQPKASKISVDAAKNRPHPQVFDVELVTFHTWNAVGIGTGALPDDSTWNGLCTLATGSATSESSPMTVITCEQGPALAHAVPNVWNTSICVEGCTQWAKNEMVVRTRQGLSAGDEMR